MRKTLLTWILVLALPVAAGADVAIREGHPRIFFNPQTWPELVARAQGSAKPYLDKLIEQKTGMAVTIAENAFEAVALGTGRSLEDVEKLKLYAKAKYR